MCNLKKNHVFSLVWTRPKLSILVWMLFEVVSELNQWHYEAISSLSIRTFTTLQLDAW